MVNSMLDLTGGRFSEALPGAGKLLFYWLNSTVKCLQIEAEPAAEVSASFRHRNGYFLVFQYTQNNFGRPAADVKVEIFPGNRANQSTPGNGGLKSVFLCPSLIECLEKKGHTG